MKRRRTIWEAIEDKLIGLIDNYEFTFPNKKPKLPVITVRELPPEEPSEASEPPSDTRK